MKIRKLIISAKLEQIENKNQNILIFHCSANASQWRYLKNFLYEKSTDTLQESQKIYLQSPQVLSGQIEKHNFSFVQAYTFFQSTGVKRKLSVAEGFETCESSGTFVIARKRSRTITNTYSRIGASSNQIVPSSTKSGYKKAQPKGCLFFFDTTPHMKSHQKNSECLEFMKKIESLEFNKNLILLYGRLNSTIVNHVDVKEALKLETTATYQQFFTSMYSPILGLSFCLDQQIGQFLGVQESRAELSEKQ
jgi:hypothetical protein